ncbi:M16 family metallopeptidase [Pseudochrobactrum sp. MP213Fo]|uniref:M16 family metallopeptidase n=1 Tax=Pseudochrobactrum sp. MP213Fo TaxID=3022250 RepID=UPI003BA1A5B7
MGVEVSVLSNGLTIATETMPLIESVALGIWVKAGSRNEAQNRHGVAHFLEHMAFKGTENRSAWQIAVDIENVGGEINAATSVETTSYYARVLRNDLPLAIDILADILTSSKFDEDELEREKNVIMQEIGAAHDTPDDVVFDRFSETAYLNQQIGRSILGEPETVQSFTSQDLRTYINEQYSADRMVVVAAGAVDHASFVREVESRLGTFRAKNTSVAPVKANYIGGDYREERDLMDAQVLIGFEGRAYHVRDFYASQLLASVLGGGMSSRLFQQVREKRGLCYSVYAFHWGFSDTGMFGIHAATGRENLDELVPVILNELYAASDNIDIQEVDRARAQYRAGLLMSQESAASRAGQIARQMLLYGRPVPNEELLERLSLITPERLTDLAGRMFLDSKPTIAAVGPVSQLMPYDGIRDTLSGYAANRQPAAKLAV